MTHLPLALLCIGLPMVVLSTPSHGWSGISDDAPSTDLVREHDRGGLLVVVGPVRPQELESMVSACRVGTLVCAFDVESYRVAAARSALEGAGYGQTISVDTWDGRQLPLIANLASTLLIRPGATLSRQEAMRVLSPGGVLLRQTEDGCSADAKPRPEAMDDWTHYLYDASNNPVGHDRLVGPPRRMQWLGGPRWSRHHEHMSSMSALVAAGRRVFYVFDEAPALSNQLAPEWKLIARDAFSGVVLWKRDLASWHNFRWPLKSGPAQLPRRLVATEQTVYVTLGIDGPIEAIDAATGQTRRVYESSRGAEELLYSDGQLIALVPEAPRSYDDYTYDTSNAVCWVEKGRVAEDYAWDEAPRTIAAIDARSGQVLWERESSVVPLSLAADAMRIYLHDGECIVALDRRDGRPCWTSEPVDRKPSLPMSTGATLLVFDDTILFTAQTGRMFALDAATGQLLWKDKQPPTGHNCPQDILGVDGLIWNAAIAGGRHDGVFRGRDPRSGEVVKEFPPDVETYWFHHRCYQAKATDDYLITSRTGIEMVDHRRAHWDIHHWVRGACLYGILPANGLIYAPQHPCICYAEAKLNGFCALAPAEESNSESETSGEETPRLEKGPAFGAIQERGRSIASDAWPTYRHDAARSGATPHEIPEGLAQQWTTPLGGKLSAPTVAGGMVFVAQVDRHRLHAIDVETGESRWSYPAGGRIDSPPTIYQEMVIFGCADGYVYCLRRSDGALVWRYRAAPADRRLVATGQLESVWPVHGAVLIRKGVVHAVAGRSMFLDGGLRLVRLDARSGQLVGESVLDDIDPTTGDSLQSKVRSLNMPVALPDILSCDGNHLYMRSQKLELDGRRIEVPTPDANATIHPSHQLGEDAHLFCPTGFLDDSWFHRGYWLFGRTFSSGCNYWFRAGRFVPAGRLLVFDDEAVYGFGRKPSLFVWTPVLQYHLFAADKHPGEAAIDHVVEANAAMDAEDKWAKMNRFTTRAAAADDISAVGLRWSVAPPDMLVRGMVLAGDALVTAGPPRLVDEEVVFRNPFDTKTQEDLARQRAALEGAEGGILSTIDRQSGKLRSKVRLSAPPVWDGLAAAQRCVFVAQTDGRVVCLGAAP